MKRAKGEGPRIIATTVGTDLENGVVIDET